MPSINDKIVLNFRDVRKKLEDLPKNVVSKVVRRAVYAGATVIRDAARSKVPVDTGALKKSIVAKANKKKGGEISASVGVARKKFSNGKMAGRSPRRYAHLVEFGTAHSAAEPFLRPAMDTRIDAVIEATRRKMVEGIDAETRR
jgi:HK97 gp10 family phage protein